MTRQTRCAVAVAVMCLGAACAGPPAPPTAPAPEVALAPWSDGPSKKALTTFVARVTTPGTPDFVPASERIAVFDNDGTLWVEQPMYVQAYFVFDRIRALAPQHPEWKDKEPFASVMKGDVKSALAGGEHALVEMVMARTRARPPRSLRGSSPTGSPPRGTP